MEHQTPSSLWFPWKLPETQSAGDPLVSLWVAGNSRAGFTPHAAGFTPHAAGFTPHATGFTPHAAELEAPSSPSLRALGAPGVQSAAARCAAPQPRRLLHRPLSLCCTRYSRDCPTKGFDAKKPKWRCRASIPVPLACGASDLPIDLHPRASTRHSVWKRAGGRQPI